MDVPNEEVGLGVDIVEIARMRKIIDRSPAFVEKVYSAAERAIATPMLTPVHYATASPPPGGAEGARHRVFRGHRLARCGSAPHEQGRPYVVLTGRAREVAREQGVREIPLSLSYTHTDAVVAPRRHGHHRVGGGHRAAARPHGALPASSRTPRPAGRPPGSACGWVESQGVTQARHPLRNLAPPRPTSTSTRGSRSGGLFHLRPRACRGRAPLPRWSACGRGRGTPTTGCRPWTSCRRPRAPHRPGTRRTVPQIQKLPAGRGHHLNHLLVGHVLGHHQKPDPP